MTELGKTSNLVLFLVTVTFNTSCNGFIDSRLMSKVK